MKMQDFYSAEKLAEGIPFEVLILAVFIGCDRLEAGEKLKEIFPKEWEFVMRAYIETRGNENEKSDC